ncbi:MAG: ribonuclease Z, partial [Candidatus Bathyarchaeota archaeon]|nr:ribonuclease Z [Candidatus Bathyarchaeota archaeon]
RLDIMAINSSHRIESWSYGLIEKPRPGRFYPEKAKALEIPKGKLWHSLQHGESVTVDGKEVTPLEVADPLRPGRRIVYSGDTRPFPGLVELAKGADLLIHESTFMDDLAERADEDGHSTTLQAAEIAREAGVKKLALTHISSRYTEPSLLLEEAKTVFKNVIVAEDFLELDIALPR